MNVNTEINTGIKKIAKSILENYAACDLVRGVYTGAGLKIESKPMVIPLDMVDIPKHLKKGEDALKGGERVMVVVSAGQQRYGIVGVLE